MPIQLKWLHPYTNITIKFSSHTKPVTTNILNHFHNLKLYEKSNVKTAIKLILS
jgi:hypothetical protein